MEVSAEIAREMAHSGVSEGDGQFRPAEDGGKCGNSQGDGPFRPAEDGGKCEVSQGDCPRDESAIGA